MAEFSTKKPRISAAELQDIATSDVPLVGQMGMRVLGVESGRVTVGLDYRGDFVRPGNTVSGPVMMAMADFAMYGAILSLIGYVPLTVTTNLNINFLSRPKPGSLVADARVFKLGRRLAVGDVHLYAEDGESLVAHATLTYSLPPPAQR